MVSPRLWTHHPPQLNVLVVGQDQHDVARFGTSRTPDAAGEQREERGGRGDLSSPPASSGSSSDPRTCHRRVRCSTRRHSATGGVSGEARFRFLPLNTECCENVRVEAPSCKV